MATAVSTPAISDPLIKLLVGPKVWSTSTLTYAFPGSWGPPTYGTNSGYPAFFILNTPAVFTTEQEPIALFAMRAVSIVSGATFTLNTSEGTIRWGNIATETRAFGPGTEEAMDRSPGDIWFTNAGADGAKLADPKVGELGGYIALQELGHALGLAHATGLAANWDSQEFTVMTYRSFVGADPAATRNETFGYAQSLMMLDIRALQEVYGANFGATANNGDTTYSWSPTTGEMFIDGAGQGAPAGNRIFLTVWDGGGTDTYDMSAYADGVTINLNPGEWSTTDADQLVDLNGIEPGNAKWARGTIANALLFNGDVRSYIENAIGGAGNDTFTGNAINNVLTGNAGDDRFYYFGGFDTLNGGANNDTADFSKLGRGVWVDLAYNGAEAWMRTGPGPNDGYYNTAIADLNDIEHVTGTGYDDDLRGGSGNNTLEGGAGNDIFRYSGGLDTFKGGAGTNTADFTMSSTGVAAAATGVVSAIGGAQIATLEHIQILIGSRFSDLLAGDSGNNLINGGDGADTLFHAGGRDVLDGDGGNDVADFSLLTGPVWIDMSFAGDEAWTRGSDLDNPLIAWTAIADLVEIERVSGTAFNDYLRGGATTLALLGQGGNDRFAFNGTFILSDGGSGSDTAEFTSLGRGLWVDLLYAGNEAWMRTGPGPNDGYYNAVIANLDNIENIIGSAYNDFISGDAGANTFDGALGNDELRGAGGNDTLRWSGGFDTLDGGADIDTADFSLSTRGVWVHLAYAGSEAWMRTGPGGNDGSYNTVIADLAGIEAIVGSAFDDDLAGDGGGNLLGWTGGFDLLDGAGGSDTADFSRSAKGVWVSLGYAGVEAWARNGAGPNDGGYNTAIADLVGMENLIGGAHNDILAGDGAANTLSWTGGLDSLDGAGGIDTADFSRSARGVWIDLAYAGYEAWMRTGPGANQGGYNTAIADLAGIENLTGTAFDDVLQGTRGVINLIAGGDGSDQVGSHLDGDTLTGGVGADTFFFLQPGGIGAAATISDFSAAGGDRIDLSRIDAIAGTGANDAFIFSAAITSFDGTAGRLILSGGVLRGDTDGNTVADFTIVIGMTVPPEALIL